SGARRRRCAPPRRWGCGARRSARASGRACRRLARRPARLGRCGRATGPPRPTARRAPARTRRTRGGERGTRARTSSSRGRDRGPRASLPSLVSSRLLDLFDALDEADAGPLFEGRRRASLLVALDAHRHAAPFGSGERVRGADLEAVALEIVEHAVAVATVFEVDGERVLT